jgi:glycosyltransferase involved in cell wall biosynthesis
MKKDENLNGISVILPVHEITEETKTLLSNAIQSVIEQTVRPDELVIVVPKGSEVSEYVKGIDYGDFKSSVVIAENEGETNFSSQVNFGVTTSKSEWISILEFDDEYAKIWFKNVVTYREKHTDVDLFLPIIIDVNANSEFIGLTNEAVWAQSFSDELGVLDNNALLAYQNFNIDGMVIRKTTYDSLGGLKSNIKLTFPYELLLRMTFKSVKVMVLPRFGYKHMNQRDGSLFSNYKDSMNAVESRWWLAQAKKEYYFAKDRNLTYQEQAL